MYASLLEISDALHLDVFQQPALQVFFRNPLRAYLSNLRLVSRMRSRLGEGGAFLKTLSICNKVSPSILILISSMKSL